MSTGYIRHDYWEPLQITPTTSYRAVFAAPSTSAPDEVVLYSNRIDWVAVARHYQTIHCKTGAGEPTDLDSWTEVVGLQLFDGCAEVCNEATNYIGLIRQGDDPIKLAEQNRVGRGKRLRVAST